MISTPDRRHAIALIDNARAQGARLAAACRELGMSARTYQRWTREGDLREDQRPLVERPTPANALTPIEEQDILDTCHRPDYAHLPPEQIVVRLLDEEARYLASTSTFYRVLHKHKEVIRRGRARSPKRHARPTTYQAKAPNRVWTWDATWLGYHAARKAISARKSARQVCWSLLIRQFHGGAPSRAWWTWHCLINARKQSRPYAWH